jgi:ketosteroid isomerase-like protein
MNHIRTLAAICGLVIIGIVATPANGQDRPDSIGVTPLPSVGLPPDLERVLRDYEQHWNAGNTAALVDLFTDDGFVKRRGGWISGHAALREALAGTSGALRLRAVSYAADERVGYIVGAYGYGNEQSVPDRGLFVLALRRGDDGRWLIAADLDSAIQQPPPEDEQ